tara:strand:+ start:408 stop:1133 length:726 start_codon:yes stop_codon:yes gene_type:complete
MLDYLLVIPARYSSSRYPGKPLININGKSMIERVWNKCVESIGIDKVIVATDDLRIEKHCKLKNISVIMTRKNCLTGTDRIYEVSKKIKALFYINVQGDEPLISSKDIKKILIESKKHPDYVINAMCEIKKKEDFFNPNIPKVIVDKNKNLLYMSRAAIPTNKKLNFINAKKQVCIYSFPYDALMKYGECSNKTLLEEIEDIEILRFLEIGIKVKMVKVSESSVAIDTPSDLKRVLKILND